ncbi:hypothetical protein D3C84_1062560 [compost metagenome]
MVADITPGAAHQSSDALLLIAGYPGIETVETDLALAAIRHGMGIDSQAAQLFTTSTGVFGIREGRLE